MKHGKTIEEIRKAEAKAKVILEEAEEQRRHILDEARKDAIKVVEEASQPIPLRGLGIDKDKAVISKETDKEINALRNKSKVNMKKAAAYVEKIFFTKVEKC